MTATSPPATSAPVPAPRSPQGAAPGVLARPVPLTRPVHLGGPPAGPRRAVSARPPAPEPPRRCPICGGPVPERLSPTGRRTRGRPRVFCSERCRLGDRRARAAVDPDLRREQVAAFAAAAREGIARRGLSLRELESVLATGYGALASSVATLSAWQTGTSSPPRTPTGRNRVLALERCLGMPVGDLALLMPGGAAVPPPRPPARPDGLAGRHARLRHLLTALGGPQQMLPVTLRKDYRLGASRRPLCARITMRMRAAHDGVDRYWFVEAADPRLHPAVVETAGCRVGRDVPEPHAGRHSSTGPRLAATELLLDRRLARGEHHDFSFLVQYDAELASPRLTESIFRHVQVQPCERLDLAVSFDRHSTPAQVLQCRWRGRDLAEVVRQVKTRPGCWQYRLLVDNPVPGGYGWRWDWAAEAAASARSGASAA